MMEALLILVITEFLVTGPFRQVYEKVDGSSTQEFDLLKLFPDLQV